jgi:hypothetical protein
MPSMRSMSVRTFLSMRGWSGKRSGELRSSMMSEGMPESFFLW